MKFESKLKKEYTEKFSKELMKELDLKNPMQVPNLEKIVVNVGLGAAKENGSLMEQVVENITLITGQKPIITKSQKAISNFKIREGMPIGVKVTLRGFKMWAFLEKIVHIVLPRVKDFRGISDKAFDGRGNYALGFRDQLVFPEIDSTKVMASHGLQIIITTTATNDKEGLALLTKLGLPFKK